MSEYIIVLCTTNSKDSAKQIAKTLVSGRFAACVNLVDKIDSIYSWKGEIVEDSEVLMIIKTQKALFENLKNKIEEIHPYETPEIISFDISEGSKPYLDWISENTKI